MAISKSTAVAGVLGTSGGAVGTVATVKYVTSKEEKTEEQKLEEVKEGIKKWAKEKGECSIKVKKTGDEESIKTLEEVKDKAVLDSLFKFLKTTTPTPTAAEQCKKTKESGGNTTHAELTLTQQSNKSDWVITNSITE